MLHNTLTISILFVHSAELFIWEFNTATSGVYINHIAIARKFSKTAETTLSQDLLTTNKNDMHHTAYRN
jgi:hypothetical protein